MAPVSEHESESSQGPRGPAFPTSSPPFSLPCSLSCSALSSGSSLLLPHTRHDLTPGPLHLPFPLPGMLVPSPFHTVGSLTLFRFHLKVTASGNSSLATLLKCHLHCHPQPFNLSSCVAIIFCTCWFGCLMPVPFLTAGTVACFVHVLPGHSVGFLQRSAESVNG